MIPRFEGSGRIFLHIAHLYLKRTRRQAHETKLQAHEALQGWALLDQQSL